VAGLAAVVIFHLSAQANGVYRAWRSEPLKNEVFAIWGTWAVVVPVLLLLAFATKTSESYSRVISLAWFAGAPVLLSVSRLVVRMTLQEMRLRGRNTRTVAFAGASQLAESVARNIVSAPWMGMEIVGYYDDRHPDRVHQIPEEFGSLKGNLDRLLVEARAGRVDQVYICLPFKAEPRINEIIRRLADTTASVYLAYDFGGFDILHAEWGSVGDVPVMSVVENPFGGLDGWSKRFEDVVLGTVILALISVPMVIIAAGVKLTSRGPVFFRQRRYGLNGEQIGVLKFRTMTVCEDGASVVQATRNDARITRFGAFLRRTSLDELPQFIHVVTGSMSIVGPRPHAVAHNEQYRSMIQGYMLRHKVKPGITGWAQVNGWRGETDTLEKMEKRVEFDLAYIRNWELVWDLKIIFLTVFGRATSRNAY
jgi:putative colanic acid biosynthesis UDP-glucose lipid carrier transferase